MGDLSETLNTETENIKKNQSVTKNTITDIKNTQDGINSRVEEAEEQISDLEKTVMKSKQLSRWEKNNTQNENRHRELSDSIMNNNSHITEIPEGED